jgi:hypothetical protein
MLYRSGGFVIMSVVEVSSKTRSGNQSWASCSPKLGWTLDELACSLSVSVPFLRLEVKRGRLKAAHLGRRVVLLDSEVRRYLAQASDRAA